VAVHILLEHPVPDYDAWKAAFDSDPLHRKSSGVRAYRILRPLGNPGYVAVDLEFDDTATANGFRDALLRLWQTPRAQSVMGQARIQVVEEAEALAFAG
jgi:hypothetical protein